MFRKEMLLLVMQLTWVAYGLDDDEDIVRKRDFLFMEAVK
jgi:hypothetical protein